MGDITQPIHGPCVPREKEVEENERDPSEGEEAQQQPKRSAGSGGGNRTAVRPSTFTAALKAVGQMFWRAATKVASVTREHCCWRSQVCSNSCGARPRDRRASSVQEEEHGVERTISHLVRANPQVGANEYL